MRLVETHQMLVLEDLNEGLDLLLVGHLFVFTVLGSTSVKLIIVLKSNKYLGQNERHLLLVQLHTDFGANPLQLPPF
jgi:hypothetical protein